MSKRSNGRHRAPSRLDNAVVVSARATAVLATTGGIASIAAPANAAPMIDRHTITLQDRVQDQNQLLPATQDPTLNRSIAELPTDQDVNTMTFGAASSDFEVVAPALPEPKPAPEPAPAETTATDAAQTDTTATETPATPAAQVQQPAAAPQQQAPVRRATTTTRRVQQQAPARQNTVSRTQTRAAVTTPAPQVETSSTGNGGSAIAAAAIAQVGRGQDCTALVNNALAGAGYTGLFVGTVFSGLPMVGYTVYSPQPGDIIYYTSERHVAIYIGNGMAVHGGYRTAWGETTKIDSVGISGGGVIYRRVR